LQQDLSNIATKDASLEQLCAALLAVFYSTKMTQAAFSVVIEFVSLVSSLKIPKTFDGVAKGFCHLLSSVF
jgi:hypothetical protein